MSRQWRSMSPNDAATYEGSYDENPQPSASCKYSAICRPRRPSARRAAFFTERGLTITRQDARTRSVCVARPPPHPRQHGQARPPAAPPSGQPPPLATGGLGAADAAGESASTVRDAGAVAAVTAQVDPGKCRVWLTVEGQGTVAAAAAALVAHWRPRSTVAAAAVTAKERNVFTEHGWAEREAAVRANWRQERGAAGRGRATPRQAPPTLGTHRPQNRAGRGVSEPTPALPRRGCRLLAVQAAVY